MEILALRATISESSLNELAGRRLPKELPVEGLRFQVTAEGLLVRGAYPLFVTVNFETLWQLSVHEGKLLARLAHLRTLGMPMGSLKGLVMNVLATTAQKEEWLGVESDTVAVDVERLLAREGLPARLNLLSVRCEPGAIHIEAGTAAL